MFPLQIPVRINHPRVHSKNIWPVSPPLPPITAPLPPSTSLLQSPASLAFRPMPIGGKARREPPEGKPGRVAPYSVATCKLGARSIFKCLSADPAPWDPRADFKSWMRASAALGPALGSPPLLQYFPGWGWRKAGVRRVSVGLPGRIHASGPLVSRSPALCPEQAPALEKLPPVLADLDLGGKTAEATLGCQAGPSGRGEGGRDALPPREGLPAEPSPYLVTSSAKGAGLSGGRPGSLRGSKRALAAPSQDQRPRSPRLPAPHGRKGPARKPGMSWGWGLPQHRAWLAGTSAPSAISPPPPPLTTSPRPPCSSPGRPSRSANHIPKRIIIPPKIRTHPSKPSPCTQARGSNAPALPVPSLPPALQPAFPTPRFPPPALAPSWPPTPPSLGLSPAFYKPVSFSESPLSAPPSPPTPQGTRHWGQGPCPPI